MLSQLRSGFIIGAIVLLVDAVLPLILAHRVADMRTAADAATVIRDNLHALLSAYKDAETGQRGFMITGKPVFLEPYHSGRAAIEKLLPQLHSELQYNPQQLKRFTQLLDLDRAEAQFLQQGIAQRDDHNWRIIDSTERGKLLMDAIRATISELSTIESQRIDSLFHRVAELQHWSEISLIVITALDFILFSILFVLMGYALRAERAAKAALTEVNNNLSSEISLRKEAMTNLAAHSDHLNQIVQTQTALAEAQLDMQAFMNMIVQRMLAITPATGAVIELIEDDAMVYVATSGSISDFNGLRLPRRGSLSGLCVDNAEVLIAADTSTDPRVDRAACAKVGAATMVAAPLTRLGETVGVLKIVSNQLHTFDDSDVRTLQLMAGFLGAALSNQQQFEKNQTLLAERSITLATLKRELLRREEYEQKLLLQRATLHAITNAIPALVSQISADEHYLYCNEEYEKIYGTPVESIIGISVREFMGDVLYDESKVHIARTLIGESVLYERVVPTQIGLRHQECRHIPQFDADGKPNGFYLIAWDITERKLQEIEWQSRASIDNLTGVLNRAFFVEALNVILLHHLRTQACIAVFYLDIDRFKHINDTYGHAAGDALLTEFANHLKHCVRKSDVVGRFGGDEFCIVLDDIKTPANAIAVAEKILAAVRTPVIFENITLSISTSIGIAYAQGARHHSSNLIALADAALYKAKQAGRNCYALEMAPSAQYSSANTN